MKNKIGFIAVGQAGGNIGQQFEKEVIQYCILIHRRKI